MVFGVAGSNWDTWKIGWTELLRSYSKGIGSEGLRPQLVCCADFQVQSTHIENSVVAMHPFEFGDQLPHNEDYHEFEFAFDSPVTVSPYVLDLWMPVPMQPWHDCVLHSKSNAFKSARGSQSQLQQLLMNANNHQHDISPLHSPSHSGSQLQQLFIDLNDLQYNISPQLQSNYGPEAPSYYSILNKRQPLSLARQFHLWTMIYCYQLVPNIITNHIGSLSLESRVL
jgi:hypothetical protein